MGCVQTPARAPGTPRRAPCARSHVRVRASDADARTRPWLRIGTHPPAWAAARLPIIRPPRSRRWRELARAAARLAARAASLAVAPARGDFSTQRLQHAATPARGDSSTRRLQHAAYHRIELVVLEICTTGSAACGRRNCSARDGSSCWWRWQVAPAAAVLCQHQRAHG